MDPDAVAPAGDPTTERSETAGASQGPCSTVSTGAISPAPASPDRTPSRDIVERDQVRSLASGEPSPLSSRPDTPTETSSQHRRHLKSLRPFVHAVMAFTKTRKFSTGTSVHRKRQMSTLVEKEGHFGPALTVCSFLSRPLGERVVYLTHLYRSPFLPSPSLATASLPITTQHSFLYYSPNQLPLAVQLYHASQVAPSARRPSAAIDDTTLWQNADLNA